MYTSLNIIGYIVCEWWDDDKSMVTGLWYDLVYITSLYHGIKCHGG